MPREEVAKKLYLVRYGTNKIKYRISMVEEAHMSLEPSMISKSQEKFLDSVAEFNKQKAILRGRSLKQYFADRLNTDIQTVEKMFDSYQGIRTCNVNEMEQKLDYLLNEAGVSVKDIIQYSIVLIRPLEQMKNRIQELQSYGVQSCCILLYAANQYTKDYKNIIIKLKNEQEAVNKK